MIVVQLAQRYAHKKTKTKQTSIGCALSSGQV
jgi:hypothetical protein